MASENIWSLKLLAYFLLICRVDKAYVHFNGGCKKICAPIFDKYSSGVLTVCEDRALAFSRNCSISACNGLCLPDLPQLHLPPPPLSSLPAHPVFSTPFFSPLPSSPLWLLLPPPTSLFLSSPPSLLYFYAHPSLFTSHLSFLDRVILFNPGLKLTILPSPGIINMYHSSHHFQCINLF